jgi:hypothetical protein
LLSLLLLASILFDCIHAVPCDPGDDPVAGILMFLLLLVPPFSGVPGVAYAPAVAGMPAVSSTPAAAGRVPNFEQKKYFAEDKTRRNRPLSSEFRLFHETKSIWNSVPSYSVEQKRYWNFVTNHSKAFQSKFYKR